jgi:hypothetical protein
MFQPERRGAASDDGPALGGSVRGLNGHSAEVVKQRLAAMTGYPKTHIRLFGSRITGGFTDASDLDVAILDAGRLDDDLVRVPLDDMTAEIRFVDRLTVSWLARSV